MAARGPKGKPLSRVREIRAELEARVQDLLLARSWLPWTIRDARPEDRKHVEELLRLAELSTERVAAHFASFTVAVDAASRVTGVAGLELYGRSALLRSVAVRPGTDHRGLGSLLIALRAREGTQRRRIGGTPAHRDRAGLLRAPRVSSPASVPTPPRSCDAGRDLHRVARFIARI